MEQSKTVLTILDASTTIPASVEAETKPETKPETRPETKPEQISSTDPIDLKPDTLKLPVVEAQTRSQVEPAQPSSTNQDDIKPDLVATSHPNSLDEAIEQAIRKVTSQDSCPSQTQHRTANGSPNQAHQPHYYPHSAYSAASPAPAPAFASFAPNGLMMMNYPLPAIPPSSSNLQAYHPQVSPTMDAPSNATSKPVPPTANLPQDIMHILDSDFTNTNGTNDDDRRQAELNRITEELRIKVRLSRYQRARDETSDSETENESDSDEAQDSSHLRPVKGENLTGDAEEEEDADSEIEGSDVDGSGDEEMECIKNIEFLNAIRKEIDEACAPNTAIDDVHVPSPLNTESVEASILETDVLSLVPSESVPTLDPPTSSLVDQTLPCNETQNDTQSKSGPDDVPAANSVKPATGNKSRRRARKRKSQVRAVVDDEDSDSDSDSNELGGANNVGPTTEHELKEVPATIIELPFEKVPESELKTIKSFGLINSLIDNIVVIKGDPNMGYETVLDEGSMICWQDGILIGRIFETFGAVTEPHYSIRLLNRLQEMAKSPTESSRFSPTTPVYFVPSQSSFLFTSQIRAQPKGTDASNFYDEEVTNADEIEFSDDEAEAAYVRSCKMARKTAAIEKRQAKPSAKNPQVSTSTTPNPDLLISAGKNMIDKRPSDALNYNDEDGDGADSDYSILERPKAGLDYSLTAPCLSAPNPVPKLNCGHSAPTTHSRPSDSRTRKNKPRGSARGKARGGRGSSRGGRTNAASDKRQSVKDVSGTPQNSHQHHPPPVNSINASTSSPLGWVSAGVPSSSFPSTFFNFQHMNGPNLSNSGPQHVPHAFGGFGGFNPHPPSYSPHRPNLITSTEMPSTTPNQNPAIYAFSPSLFNMSSVPQYQSNMTYPSYSMIPQQSVQQRNMFQSQMSTFLAPASGTFTPDGYQQSPQQPYYGTHPPYPSPTSFRFTNGQSIQPPRSGNPNAEPTSGRQEQPRQPTNFTGSL
ncbi:hypothetical protein CROQUDRAFT_717477 [Cronartium quercuum f. sp. fusiforme G11]|uniref:H/ACA ribonucleoprotein complex non-core subunit NAF1 n=1 Tax=Cronartium quercuum f. sp. fusiforme G11 TaxID=708437 RepID=A0A9P6NBC2_9BASI|nr:hypothetical protein CROQUDRAFT_717477 [Cronartium quercuum f. sp. fusiforme G11]